MQKHFVESSKSLKYLNILKYLVHPATAQTPCRSKVISLPDEEDQSMRWWSWINAKREETGDYHNDDDYHDGKDDGEDDDGDDYELRV